MKSSSPYILPESFNVVLLSPREGLNEPSQIQEVNKFLSNNKVQVVALLETRIRIHNVEKMKRKFLVLVM